MPCVPCPGRVVAWSCGHTTLTHINIHMNSGVRDKVWTHVQAPIQGNIFYLKSRELSGPRFQVGGHSDLLDFVLSVFATLAMTQGRIFNA